MASLTSCLAVEDILDGVVLEDFQCVDLVRTLLYKVMILNYETGMGKTLLAAAIIKAFLNEMPSRRFIMVVQKSQLDQTPQEIKKWTGLDVLSTTAESRQIDRAFYSQDSLKYPILMITHDTLKNVDAMRALHLNRDRYFGIIVDEVHLLSNFIDSGSGMMLRGLLNYFQVKVGLTATPVTTQAEQVVNLAFMFDPKKIEDVKQWVTYVKNGAPIMDEMPDLFIRRTRKDLGIANTYKTMIEYVDAHPHQIGVSGKEMFAVTKAKGAYNQANRTAHIILKEIMNGRRGLVYVHHHASREWLEEILRGKNIRFDSIHGLVKSEQRKIIFDKFAKGELDVVLTSVTTALNLDCEYVIFYEYTRNIKQMIGRAERGLNPKTLYLYFIFTQETGEVDYFLNGIYATSLWIQEVLRQDYRNLVDVGKGLLAQRG